LARVPITLMGCRCDNCRYEWIPRTSATQPKQCPRCKRRDWDSRGQAVDYDEFRRRIVQVLTRKRRLTWTEVRTHARLPQAFPNNRWVRRLESDVGLSRHREHGIMYWQLDRS
jgi:hypothetical protein